MRDPALQKAIDKSGGVNKLARLLGIKPGSLSEWVKTPALRVLHVERASGVSRHLLRPDLYPRERKRAGTEARAS